MLLFSCNFLKLQCVRKEVTEEIASLNATAKIAAYALMQQAYATLDVRLGGLATAATTEV